MKQLKNNIDTFVIIIVLGFFLIMSSIQLSMNRKGLQEIKDKQKERAEVADTNYLLIRDIHDKCLWKI